MATTTLTPRARAMRSTVLMKAVMAVSGLIMVGYLLVHMYGNLMVFGGAAAFNDYAAHLRTIGEPMIPYGGVLWVVRIVLLVSVVAHIASAVVLTRRSHHATRGGKRYQSKRARALGVQRTFASFTVRWGGVTILLYVIFHLLHLTWKVINPGGAGDPYGRVVNSFQHWWMVLIYLVALVMVALHLRHGVWSGLTTLGLNTSATARRNLNVIAIAVAGVILIGFLLPPFAILLGLVK
ncbi:succinate dehydrogenase cytochrome b subunit [Propionibacteriaceae bacterium Y2011]|uniref:succinate dehydrogenase cytochrome b subunit n=1 Tax=Microlunatus sp. Y2014 TaxID=3418488 RepID=UPI003B462F0A